MKYFDTSYLLNHYKDLFKIDNEPFCICDIVLKELEEIKNSRNKVENVRYDAREAVRLLYNNQDKFLVSLCDNVCYDLLKTQYNLPANNDNLIAICACQYQSITGEQIDFYTEDLLLSIIAREVFKLNVINTIDDTNNDYRGFKVVDIYDNKVNDFYADMSKNIFDCKINEYLVFDDNGKIDNTLYKWNGNQYVKCVNKALKTFIFGDKIKAKDIYQQMAIDSIMNNTITAITGEAGSGKSLLSLLCAMWLIENHRYDRLIILFNPTTAKGASQLGYYQGSMLDKALQTSVGNILITKFGDAFAVDSLIKQDKIRLVSMADQRGMEIRENEILWITECQNCSIDLLKLCLQRSTSKVIIEGDYKSQVDSYLFEGYNNGLKRAIDVFSGDELFGYVDLQNVWRSKICELACKM